jgi:predicted TIM-barrel fold metal-dependent hydrolase
VDAVQGEHEAALSAALADFQQRYGIETDSPAFKVVAASLASLPNAANVLSSPEALTAALEQAYEHTADATVAFAKSVDEQNFRQAFRQESLRHGSMRPRTDDHLAQMAARRIGPSTVEDQALEIIRRAKGTNEDRRAAVAARNDEFRGAFAEASRSKFAEGNRAGAARAIKARDEGSDRRAGAF